MVSYLIRRLLQAVLVLIGVTIIAFIISNKLPGDPARSAAGQYATPAQVEATRERLGLNQPLPIQYLKYMQRLLSGDLGLSISSRQAVLTELKDFFPATIELTIAAALITGLVGIPLGILAGASRSRWLRSGIITTSLIGVGIPVFWAGLIFQLIFGGRLHLLPLSGRLSLGVMPPPDITHMYTVDALLTGQWSTLGDALTHLILPALTLSIGHIGAIARLTYSSVVSIMRRDYIRTARAKGLRERSVLWGHVLRNAMLPISTIVGLYLGFMLGGALLVENIFSWGGLGTYAWIGIFRNDVPVIMGVTLVSTLTFMSINLIVDLLYPFLDPRIRYGKG